VLTTRPPPDHRIHSTSVGPRCDQKVSNRGECLGQVVGCMHAERPRGGQWVRGEGLYRSGETDRERKSASWRQRRKRANVKGRWRVYWRGQSNGFHVQRDDEPVECPHTCLLLIPIHCSCETEC
jgi:hypothetical protein